VILARLTDMGAIVSADAANAVDLIYLKGNHQ
jgi:hypothetical protein